MKLQKSDAVKSSHTSAQSGNKDAAPIAGLLALVGAVAAIIGSFGPWATVNAGFFSASVSGMSGDGQITAPLAIIATALILYRLFRQSGGASVLIAFVLLSVVSAVGILDWANIADLMSDDTESILGLVQTGWGIEALLFGPGWGSFFLMTHWFRREI
jgi:hypothetical protein